MPEELARAVSVEKRYGDLVAVRSATCSFHAGEVHAVCGENGAGKSTLLKIVAGMLRPDAGHVEAFGRRLAPHTPREAIARGVGMVLQHFALVPAFTALENLVLGAEPSRGPGVLAMDEARRRADAVATQIGVEIPWDERVEALGVGDRQRLEIARALFRDAKLLVLDEPTAVLTKGEATALYTMLRRLALDGKGIVVVTHKMDEVREHADVVTVMRRGELLFTRPLDRGGDVAKQIEAVASAIMGGGVGSDAGAADRGPAKERDEAAVLELVDVCLGRALHGIRMSVRSGEILGIAGVEGNGQRELVAVLAGDVQPDAGTVKSAGALSVIREDRQVDGLVLDASLRDNLVLGELATFSRPFRGLDLVALDREAGGRLSRSGVAAGLDAPARTLSGGNQQKIVVSRALARLAPASGFRVLVAAQPTRGVDLAASRDIHARLRRAADAGAGVIVISADVDEVRALCDRVLVMSRGRIVADVPPSTSDEELGRLMLGIESSRIAAGAGA